MNQILIRPQELRQTAEQLQAYAKKIDVALQAIDNDMLSLKRDNFLGNRANAVQAHYAPKREALLKAKEIVSHFAEDLRNAAIRFEQADKAEAHVNVDSNIIGPDFSNGISIGEPTHPNIIHDNGFTEYCSVNPHESECSSNPTPNDYINWAKYKTLLSGAKLLGHLDNGIKAYEHYLYGKGEDWHFSYGEFINEDANGRIAFDNILSDVQKNIEIVGQGRSEFNITSNPYIIGGGDPRFPYPSTENWQKAIGAHQVWVSANVEISANTTGNKVYTMEITYHAEDRYNFNPGASDIATGALDRDNGRFEVLGWAHPFMSYGETTRTVTWVEGDISNPQISQSLSERVSEYSNDARLEIRDR